MQRLLWVFFQGIQSIIPSAWIHGLSVALEQVFVIHFHLLLLCLVMTQQAQHRMAPTAALDRNRSVHSLAQYFHSLVTLENLTHCGNSMLTALGIYQMLDGSP